MKIKQYLFATLLLSAILGCRPDSGDGVMDRPDYTMVNYQLTISDEFLMFYDVKVNYQNVEGMPQSETVTNVKWQFKEKADGHHANFSLSATATAKSEDKRGHLNNDSIPVRFTCDYSAEYYSKATSAKRIHNEWASPSIKKENIDTYLSEHPTIKLCELDMTSFSK